MRTKLTPTFVKEAPLPEKGDRVIYWEVRQPGFGLMVTSTGARSFVFQYRNAQQISRRWTWTIDLPLLYAGGTDVLPRIGLRLTDVYGQHFHEIDPTDAARCTATSYPAVTAVVQRRSMMVALARPPASHMVCRP